MAYRYKLTPRPPKETLNRIQGTSEDEALTGFVNGKEASDLEERWAGAEKRANREFIFQFFMDTPFSLPGEDRQIDIVDTTEVWQPVELDGGIAHKGGAQRAKDKVRDAILNAELAKQGVLPILRIDGDSIATPEDADRVLREIFG